MRTRIALLAAAALLIAGWSGCWDIFRSFGDGGAGTGVARYFPLAVGNSWTYLWSHPRTGAAPSEFLREIIRADSGWFEARESAPDGVDPKIVRLSHENGGVVYRSGLAFHLATYLLKRPVSVGTSWCTAGNFCGEIVSTNATITTPMGKFRNVVVVEFHQYADSTHTASTAHSVQYFAPNVGHIRNDLYLGEPADRPDERWELTGYILR